MTELYVGLLSGTSMDGIDAGLFDLRDGRIDEICERLARSGREQPRRLLAARPQAPQRAVQMDVGGMQESKRRHPGTLGQNRGTVHSAGGQGQRRRPRAIDNAGRRWYRQRKEKSQSVKRFRRQGLPASGEQKS